MKMSSLTVVPAAIVLVLASTVTAAEDKFTANSKPVTTLSKSAKQKPAAPQDAAVKTVKQGTEQGTEKGSTPSAVQGKPISERSSEGCEHSKSSDA